MPGNSIEKNPCKRIIRFFCKDCCFWLKTAVFNGFSELSQTNQQFLLREGQKVASSDDHGAEQTRPEQIRADQTRADLIRADLIRAGSTSFIALTELNRADRAEPSRADPRRQRYPTPQADPSRSEPSRLSVLPLVFDAEVLAVAVVKMAGLLVFGVWRHEV